MAEIVLRLLTFLAYMLEVPCDPVACYFFGAAALRAGPLVGQELRIPADVAKSFIDELM